LSIYDPILRRHVDALEFFDVWSVVLQEDRHCVTEGVCNNLGVEAQSTFILSTNLPNRKRISEHVTVRLTFADISRDGFDLRFRKYII